MDSHCSCCVRTFFVATSLHSRNPEVRGDLNGRDIAFWMCAFAPKSAEIGVIFAWWECTALDSAEIGLYCTLFAEGACGTWRQCIGTSNALRGCIQSREYHFQRLLRATGGGAPDRLFAICQIPQMCSNLRDIWSKGGKQRRSPCAVYRIRVVHFKGREWDIAQRMRHFSPLFNFFFFVFFTAGGKRLDSSRE